jgi:hypothetical protein
MHTRLNLSLLTVFLSIGLGTWAPGKDKTERFDRDPGWVSPE